jgi:hypothetical protein
VSGGGSGASRTPVQLGRETEDPILTADVRQPRSAAVAWRDGAVAEIYDAHN